MRKWTTKKKNCISINRRRSNFLMWSIALLFCWFGNTTCLFSQAVPCDDFPKAYAKGEAKLKQLQAQVDRLVKDKKNNKDIPLKDLEDRFNLLCEPGNVFYNCNVKVYNDLNYFNEKETQVNRKGDFKCKDNVYPDQCPSVGKYYKKLLTESTLQNNSKYAIDIKGAMDGGFINQREFRILFRNIYFLNVGPKEPRAVYKPHSLVARFYTDEGCEVSIEAIDLASIEELNKELHSIEQPNDPILDEPSNIIKVKTLIPNPLDSKRFPTIEKKEDILNARGVPNSVKKTQESITILNESSGNVESKIGSIFTILQGLGVDSVAISSNGEPVNYIFDAARNIIRYDYQLPDDGTPLTFSVTSRDSTLSDEVSLAYTNPCLECEVERDTYYIQLADTKDALVKERFAKDSIRFIKDTTAVALDRSNTKNKQLRRTIDEVTEERDDLFIDLKTTKRNVRRRAKSMTESLRKLELNIENTINIYEKYNHQKTVFFGLNYSIFNAPFTNSKVDRELPERNLYREYFENNLGFSVYHNIGFFVSNLRLARDKSPSYNYSLVDVQRAKERLFAQNIPFQDINYIESRENLFTINTGIYVYPNLLKGMYLAIGLSHVHGEVWDYYDGDLGNQLSKEANSYYTIDKREVKMNGLYTGVAYVVPFFQVEMGYNWLFHDFGLSLGVNYPLGSVKKDRKNNSEQQLYRPKDFKLFNPSYRHVDKLEEKDNEGWRNLAKVNKQQRKVLGNIKEEIVKKIKLNQIERQYAIKNLVKRLVTNVADKFPSKWYLEKEKQAFYKNEIFAFLTRELEKLDRIQGKKRFTYDVVRVKSDEIHKILFDNAKGQNSLTGLSEERNDIQSTVAEGIREILRMTKQR